MASGRKHSGGGIWGASSGRIPRSSLEGLCGGSGKLGFHGQHRVRITLLTILLNMKELPRCERAVEHSGFVRKIFETVKIAMFHLGCCRVLDENYQMLPQSVLDAQTLWQQPHKSQQPVFVLVLLKILLVWFAQ